MNNACLFYGYHGTSQNIAFWNNEKSNDYTNFAHHMIVIEHIINESYISFTKPSLNNLLVSINNYLF